MALPSRESPGTTSDPGADGGWMGRYLDAWNSHEAERVVEFMATEAVYEDLALGQVHKGREAIAAFVATSSEFSSDHRFIPVSAQASGDAYAIEWEMLGTNDGS